MNKNKQKTKLITQPEVLIKKSETARFLRTITSLFVLIISIIIILFLSAFAYSKEDYSYLVPTIPFLIGVRLGFTILKNMPSKSKRIYGIKINPTYIVIAGFIINLEEDKQLEIKYIDKIYLHGQGRFLLAIEFNNNAPIQNIEIAFLNVRKRLFAEQLNTLVNSHIDDRVHLLKQWQ